MLAALCSHLALGVDAVLLPPFNRLTRVRAIAGVTGSTNRPACADLFAFSERPASDTTGDNPSPPSTYKVKLRLVAQQLVDPNGARLTLLPGMQIVGELQQGKRTVLEYLLSPVRKLAAEAARER